VQEACENKQKIATTEYIQGTMLAKIDPDSLTHVSPSAVVHTDKEGRSRINAFHRDSSSSRRHRSSSCQPSRKTQIKDDTAFNRSRSSSRNRSGRKRTSSMKPASRKRDTQVEREVPEILNIPSPQLRSPKYRENIIRKSYNKKNSTAHIIEGSNRGKARKSKDETLRRNDEGATSGTQARRYLNSGIINLVENDVEDFILDALLDEDSPVVRERERQEMKGRYNLRKKSSTPETSDVSESSTNPSPKSAGVRYVLTHNKNILHVDESSISRDEHDENRSIETSELLSKCSERMELQKLMEEVRDLKESLERKDEQLEQLSGQLRMAISTKCDLVIAHTELERMHELDIQQRDGYVESMKRSNIILEEMRAKIEKDFMNEIASLVSKMQSMDKDHKNESVEKDLIIAHHQENIQRFEARAARGTSVRPTTEKVKHYRKHSGMSAGQ